MVEVIMPPTIGAAIGFIILKMEAVNPERGDIRIDEF